MGVREQEGGTAHSSAFLQGWSGREETALHWHCRLPSVSLGPELGISQGQGPAAQDLACLCSPDTHLFPLPSSCPSPVTCWPVSFHCKQPVLASLPQPGGAWRLSPSHHPTVLKHPTQWSSCPHKATEQNDPKPRGPGSLGNTIAWEHLLSRPKSHRSPLTCSAPGLPPGHGLLGDNLIFHLRL